MIKIDSTHPMDEYLALLSTSLEIYMDDARLQRAYFDCCHAADDYKSLVQMWLRIESAGMFSSVSKESIIDFLCAIGVDMEKRYANKKTQSLSLDMKRVVTPLLESGVTPELLTAYKDYSSYRSYANSLRKLMASKQNFTMTPSGRALVKFPTHVDERDNLRVYYSDIAVVSVPKKFSNMITGPSDGYYLCWCDYPQADWRFAYNLFIRDEQNESVMRQCDDAYEGLVRLVEGDKFDPSEFKEKRKEYKTHCLKVFYNSKDAAPVPTAIRNLYQKSARYRKLLFDLHVLYKFKLPIPCVSYFGYEQLIPEGAYPDAFVSKALNTPIQTFTSHVVNETVFTLLNKFWDLGYTKDDINVYYVRHDEPIFMFRRSVLKDAWIFRECSEVYIPGFTPIHLDFHYGLYYQEEDKQLTQEVEASIRNSGVQPTVYTGGQANDNYSPFPSVEYLYVTLFNRDGVIGVKLYNYRTREKKVITTSMTEITDPYDVVIEALESEGLRWLNNPQYLYIRSSGLDLIARVGADEGTLLKIADQPDSSVNMED